MTNSVKVVLTGQRQYRDRYDSIKWRKPKMTSGFYFKILAISIGIILLFGLVIVTLILESI